MLPPSRLTGDALNVSRQWHGNFWGVMGVRGSQRLATFQLPHSPALSPGAAVAFLAWPCASADRWNAPPLPALRRAGGVNPSLCSRLGWPQRSFRPSPSVLGDLAQGCVPWVRRVTGGIGPRPVSSLKQKHWRLSAGLSGLSLPGRLSVGAFPRLRALPPRFFGVLRVPAAPRPMLWGGVVYSADCHAARPWGQWWPCFLPVGHRRGGLGGLLGPLSGLGDQGVQEAAAGGVRLAGDGDDNVHAASMFRLESGINSAT